GLFQAQNFITDVKMEPGDLPPVLDVEVLDGVSHPVLINRMQSWLNIVEHHYQIKPIIYTNLKFYHQHLIGYFDDYPIWIARYSYRQPFFLDGRSWHFWQYGNQGQLAGIRGDVDFNVFHGTPDELDALCYKSPFMISAAE
ncbi:MAG: GH25 family lysozyme, partial [Bacteroidota bacterium]